MEVLLLMGGMLLIIIVAVVVAAVSSVVSAVAASEDEEEFQEGKVTKNTVKSRWFSPSAFFVQMNCQPGLCGDTEFL